MENHHRNGKNKENNSPTQAFQTAVSTAQVYKLKADTINKKYKTQRQRNNRMQKAQEAGKKEIKRLKAENFQLRGRVSILTKEVQAMQVIAENTLLDCQSRLSILTCKVRELQKTKSQLQKKCTRISLAKEQLKAKMQRQLHKGRVFSITHKGVYTAQARAMARLLVSTGTAERNVGSAIQQIGGMMGISIKEKMSMCTMQRATLELGVAGDIQLGYEMSQANGIILLV